MWKRHDRSEPPQTSTIAPDPRSSTELARPKERRPTRGPEPSPTEIAASLGRSVVITGDVSGSEDLVIDGRVNGSIESPQHEVVIREHAKVKAQVLAKSVIVLGRVVGNITATAKIEIRDQGRVEGDLSCPTVVITPGATFRGSIDMSGASAESAA